MLFLLIGCEGNVIEIRERPSMPEIKEPTKPNYERYSAIEKKIEEAFAAGSAPLTYVANKNPFSSAIEEYLASLKQSNQDNPLLIPLEKIKLVGILDSEVGKVGVVEALNQIFFVRLGDKIGNADGVIIDITANAILVRETNKDIFGEYHTTIKELRLATREGTS
jgi:Tfp pilus assembly protein PilP